MQTLVINLDRSPERLEYMRGQLAGLCIDFERLPGIDGQDLGRHLPDWLQGEFVNSPLTPGKIGSYASHLLAAREIVSRGLLFALILEDDVDLDDDLLRVAHRAVALTPPGWDVIHLSTNFKRGAVPVVPLTDERQLVLHSRLPVNTAAYILSNAGARKRLRPRQRIRPNDMDFLRYAWLDGIEVYGVIPAPAVQRDRFPSDIGAYKREKWSPGLASELGGLLWQLRRTGFAPYVRARLGRVKESR